MNIKTKCEKCNKEIKVWLTHYILRKIRNIFKLKEKGLAFCYVLNVISKRRKNK